MTEGLKYDLLGGGLIQARPSAELSASDAVLKLLTGPLKTFSDKVDATLADQNRRIKQLEEKLPPPRSPMMLRTAETEERIAELEKAVNRIMRHLGLSDDDTPDLSLPGVQPPDGGSPDGGPVERPAAELRSVRPEGNEPRVQAPGDRRKRSR